MANNASNASSPSQTGSSDSGADNLAAFLADLALDPMLDVATSKLAEFLAVLDDSADLDEARRAEWEWAEGAFVESEFGPEGSSSSVEPRTPGTFDEVERVVTAFGSHLRPSDRESLRRSHAPLLRLMVDGPTFQRRQDGLIVGSSITVLMDRARRRCEPSDMPVVDEEAAAAETFPAGPLEFGDGEAMGESLPVELMLRLYQYMSPMDELVLAYTHANLFHSDRFSLYYLDIEYQLHWQQGNSAYDEDQPRLPLLHHAIKSGAPVRLICDIMDTWQSRGLDFELQWSQENGARTRHSKLFMKPAYLAAMFGRVDVIRELLSRGADLDPVVKGLVTAPFQSWSQKNLNDQAWADLETLALETPGIMTAFLSFRAFQGRAKRLYEACVRAGWRNLLAYFVEPMGRLAVMPDRLMFRRLLAAELGVWVNVVGHVRADNTAMIDYLFHVWERLVENTRGGLQLTDWHGLDELVFQSTPLLRDQPLRLANAAHLINTFAPTQYVLAVKVDQWEYRSVCLRSDDRLPLLQAVITQTISFHQWHTPDPADFELHVRRMGFNLLCAAMVRRQPAGLPNTVRWLVRDMQAPIWYNGLHALSVLTVRSPWEQAGPARADPAPTRAHLGALLDRLGGDPNQVLPGFHSRVLQRDPRPLDLLALDAVAVVELVARGGVDLALAGQPTVDRVVRARAGAPTYCVEAGGRSLPELMRHADFPYDVRKRIVWWCILARTNTVPDRLDEI